MKPDLNATADKTIHKIKNSVNWIDSISIFLEDADSILVFWRRWWDGRGRGREMEGDSRLLGVQHISRFFSNLPELFMGFGGRWSQIWHYFLYEPYDTYQ